MLRTLQRSISTQPLLHLSASGFTPPPFYPDIPKVGLFRGFYELFHDTGIDIITGVSDMGYGMGIGVVVGSLLLRGIYTPFIIYSQVCGMKLQKLAPEMSHYRMKVMELAREGKRDEMTEMSEALNLLKREHGIRASLQMVPVTQIPLILTFYWTVLEMCKHPELYPALHNEQFLWFNNLASPDPYYLISVMLAASTFFSLHNNPSLKLMEGPAADIMKYMKYATILGMPITAQFPSAIVLNWFIMSFFQLICNQIVYNKPGQKLFGVPDVLPGTVMAKLKEMKKKEKEEKGEKTAKEESRDEDVKEEAEKEEDNAKEKVREDAEEKDMKGKGE